MALEFYAFACNALVEIRNCTTSRDAELAASGHWRYGVFFGVADYKFHDVLHEAPQGNCGLQLALAMQ